MDEALPVSLIPQLGVPARYTPSGGRGPAWDQRGPRGYVGSNVRFARKRPIWHLYSITSSARAISEGGTVSPSTCAVVRLITRSNLVGCSTGMSPGFDPRSILST